jgi:AraC-like DNA-binding protein
MELIRGTALSGFHALTTELGADPVPILRSVGIRPDDTEDIDGFVSLRSAVRALERAAEVTATPDFGRQLASRQDIGILGPLAVAVRTAATVADVFAVFETFVAAYSRGIAITARPLEDSDWTFLQWELRLDPLPPHSQAVELSLGVIVGALRTFLGPDYRPAKVHVQHELLTPAADYHRFYGCPVHARAAAAGFVVSTADLGRRLDQDLLTHRTAIGYLERTADTTEDGAVVRSVSAAVRRALPTGAATVDVVAHEFGLHPKALQRRLAREGTSFSAVVDDVRRATAARLLRDTDMTLAGLARELGYAEQSVLTRACRRWFDCSPLAYRTAERTTT